jgi:hypothetical protein
MGIAEAIERVRRQARQVGLGAIFEGVSEQLRSNIVPSPLRGAAWRIAALLDALLPNTSAAPSERARELIHQDRAAVGAVKPQVSERPAGGETSSSSPRTVHSEVVPVASRGLDSDVRLTATDSGASPAMPDEGRRVSASAVGATPTFNATPVVADAVDATPVDDAPADALGTVVEVELASSAGQDAAESVARSDGIEAVEPSAPGEQSAPREAELRSEDAPQHAGSHANGAVQAAPNQPKPSKSRSKHGAQRKRPAAPANGSLEQEKLAEPGEAAKTLARSNSRGAKRRSGAKADTSKKK